jgi:hypothetical protein
MIHVSGVMPTLGEALENRVTSRTPMWVSLLQQRVKLPTMYDRSDLRRLWRYCSALQSELFASIHWTTTSLEAVQQRLLCYVLSYGTIDEMLRLLCCKMQNVANGSDCVDVYVGICKLNETLSQLINVTALERRTPIFQIINCWSRRLEYETSKLGNKYDKSLLYSYLQFLHELNQV